MLLINGFSISEFFNSKWLIYRFFCCAIMMLMAGCVSVKTSPAGATMSDTDVQDLLPVDSMLKRYQQAEQRLPVNLLKKVDDLYISPVWIDDGGFWYQLTENEQPTYYRYHPNSGIQPLFDIDKLAAAIGFNLADEKTKDFRILDVVGSQITFKISDQHWQCRLAAQYDCYGSSDASDNKAPLTSPDGKWQMEVRDHNLVLVDVATGTKTQLTRDGIADFPYATESANPKKFFNQPEGNVSPHKVGYWSPDSQYFLTFQLDLRKVGKLHLSQSVTGQSQRPRVYEYHYPMAGDEHLAQGHIIVVDAINGAVHRVENAPLNQTYYGDPLWGEFSEQNKYYFVERERGFHTYYLKELSPDTGKIRTLIKETNQKFIDPWVQDFRVVPEQDMVLWTSERNGMQQLFHYQLSTGKLLHEVTPASMFMRVIRGIDTNNNDLYFEASGVSIVESSDDAYYRYLYRVKLDGSELQLLTPEPAMHDTRISPDFNTFTDRYSTVQQPIQHVVRSTDDGRVLASLDTLDNSHLLAAGYVAPEPFTVIAEDGETPLHGILYFPSDFDASKRYPVINDIYTGPHGYFTPKTYDGPLYAHAHALAELGFIVFKMDGRGTGKRDRHFHEYSYDNLAGGADDHVWAIKKLAEKRAYLDLDRVGIYGFSAGGYDTVRAMYRFPDFFKVGVSASGNHDFRADKAGWNETWMGYPMGEHWAQQSNLTDAHKLKGKLFLAHGELDENVHPAATLQLVDQLIKANKDFGFLVYPNMGHVLHHHPHFVRSRWDFFVKHLLGVEPPEQYQIKSMEIPELAR